MGISTWSAIGLLLFALAVTAFSNWAVARVRRRAQGEGQVQRWASAAADLIWTAVVWTGGLIAARYTQRIPTEVVGYAAMGFGALALSLLRSWLFRRSREGHVDRPPRDWGKLARWGLHHVSYPLFASVLYLGVSALLGWSVRPVYLLPLLFGALLPDLDCPDSPLGTLVPFLSRRLEARFGHRGAWHSLGANAGFALITWPLVFIIGSPAWAAILLGFLAHIALDLFDEHGIPLWWPLSEAPINLLGGPLGAEGSPAHSRLVVGLLLACALVLSVVELGPPPAPAVPTYEQSVQRYYSLRGRNLVFADVEGTWQATTRRITGRFEVLNARGESLIMLDRYSGRVFTAGRTASDNLYLNRLSIAPGAQARVKPVEVHLHSKALAEVLPTLYQMQAEDGLQHIYVSGDLSLPPSSDPETLSSRTHFGQTEMRHLQSEDGRHFRLDYLTASDLITLGSMEVEAADLVIVATYAQPPSGPTSTPLPRPPAATGPVDANGGAP